LEYGAPQGAFSFEQGWRQAHFILNEAAVRRLFLWDRLS
jgi:hypothetical protein